MDCDSAIEAGVKFDIGSNIDTKDNKRTLSKSQKWWKRVQSTRPLTTSKPKSSWKKKMKEKRLQMQLQMMQGKIRIRILEEKAKKVEEKKQREERRKQNELKSNVVQVIKNTAKVKRMRKKELKKIQKRDTIDLIK